MHNYDYIRVRRHDKEIGMLMREVLRLEKRVSELEAKRNEETIH